MSEDLARTIEIEEFGGADAMQGQLDWDVDFWGGVIQKNNISLD